MVLYMMGQTSSRSLGSMHVFCKEYHFTPTGRIQFLKIILSPPKFKFSLSFVYWLFKMSWTLQLENPQGHFGEGRVNKMPK